MQKGVMVEQVMMCGITKTGDVSSARQGSTKKLFLLTLFFYLKVSTKVRKFLFSQFVTNRNKFLSQKQDCQL